MGPNSWILIQYLAIPLMLAGIILAARASIYRAIRWLSIAALAIAGVKWILFFVIYNQYPGFFQPTPSNFDTSPSATIIILNELYYVALSLAIISGIAAWAIAMWDAAHTRRRQWFTCIVVVAVISYFIAAIGDNPYFFNNMFPALSNLYTTNFMMLTIFLGTVAHLSAVVTLSYSYMATKPPIVLASAATTLTEKDSDNTIDDDSLVLLGREKLPRK